MRAFLTLLTQMIPLYALIGAGFIAGRWLKVTKEPIAKLLLYILLPVITFNGIYSTPLNWRVLSMPLLAFSLCCLIAALIYLTASIWWKDSTRNLLAAGLSNGNFGYIGLPLTILIFGNKYLATTALFGLGGSLFVASVAMFIAARGRYDAAASLLKVLRMPAIYAAILGLIINSLGIHFSDTMNNTLLSFNGAYSILGLMLVGIAINDLKKFKFDFILAIYTTIATFVLWPVVALGLVALDKNFLHLYNADIYKIILLMSVVPVGDSIVAIATEMKLDPAKASFIVLFTTLVSLIYIPFFMTVFI